MNILAISTASRSTLITINHNNRCINKMLEFSRHSENLFPLLIKTLEENQIALKDFDVFGCVVGPGSFTGIRIGLSVIKGFGYANNKPVVGVNSLELLAHNVDTEGQILAVINAGAGLVYHQLFESKNGQVVALNEPKLDKFSHFLAYRDTLFDVEVVYSQNNEKGEDYSSYLGDSADFTLQALNKAILQKVNNKEFLSATALNPLYLRVSQAEQMLKNLTFDRLSEADLTAIMALEVEHDEYDLPWSEVATRQSFDNPSFECYGIKSDDELVGIISVLDNGHNVEILRVKVQKKCRLLGLGQKLLEGLLAIKKVQGVPSIELEVDERNYPAIGLYQKFGFEIVGKRPKYYHNKYDAILMNFALV